MKTTPNTKKGLVRDVLDYIFQGLTDDQILNLRGWTVEEFYSERDKVTKFKVRDSAKYFVTGNHKTRDEAVEAALYDPYRN